jgi:hypothetical protein
LNISYLHIIHWFEFKGPGKKFYFSLFLNRIRGKNLAYSVPVISRRGMNRYKVAESIVGQIVSDLKERIGSGEKWDVSDEETYQEVTDKWEDLVLAELEKVKG